MEPAMTRSLRRWALALCCAAAPATAGAQPAPPPGQWAGPGAYCLDGVQTIVPEGFEAWSSGATLAYRGADGRLLDARLFTDVGGRTLPTFSWLRENMALSCEDGAPAALEESGVARQDGVTTVDLMRQRCASETGSYGVLLARAEIAGASETRDVAVLVFFGDRTFRVGEHEAAAAALTPETAAQELFDVVVRGIGPCQ